MRRAVLVLALGVAGCAAARPTAFERATSLAREHREADAIAVLRGDLARSPHDVRSRRLLVRVLALTGDMGAARAEVETLARELGEADPVPWIELGHAYELAHAYEQALEMYDRAAEIAPADPRGPREGGMRSARWGEVEAALPRLQEATRRGARDGAVWHALGLVKVHLHDPDGAEEAYRAGLAADPSALECALGLATVAVTRGDASGALRAYETILERRPTWAPGQIGRAWALAKLGRTDEARHALDAAERQGGDPAAIFAQRRALGDLR